MPDKLMIVIANSDPGNPTEVLAPLSQATVAAAMGYQVEVIMTGCASLLVRKGYPETVIIQAGESKTIYDLIQEAVRAGVVFKLCTPTFGLTGNELIPEINETVGAAHIISESMSGETITFTY